jgi:hypothetical protein
MYHNYYMSLLHNHCMCWIIICVHISMYWKYMYCVLDALYVIHLYLILLQIFSKCHTKLFDIFQSIFFLIFPQLRLKLTGKQKNQSANQSDGYPIFVPVRTILKIKISTENRPVFNQTVKTGAHLSPTIT